MKAIRSKDGIDRYTINVKIRITPDEYRRLSKLARELEYKNLQDYLHGWAMDGLEQIEGEWMFFTKETVPPSEIYGAYEVKGEGSETT